MRKLKLIAVIVLCLTIVGLKAYESYKEDQDYKTLMTEVSVEIPQVMTGGHDEETETKPESKCDFEHLKGINPDFVGVISIPELGIKYPVVQGNDNSEYLSKDFYGEASASGSIFLEAGAVLSDWNVFIYGHNMKDGSMFGSLKNLLSMKKKAEDGIYVYLTTSEGERRYRIFAADVLNLQSNLLKIGWRADEYEQYVEEIMENNSMADTTAANGGQILSLYTCYGTDHQYKLVVYAEQEGEENI